MPIMPGNINNVSIIRNTSIVDEIININIVFTIANKLVKNSIILI